MTLYDLACDQSGNLFVADRADHAIVKFDVNGNKSIFASDVDPWSLGTDAAGNLFVWDGGVLKFTPDGNRTFFAKNPVE
jgi:sugar lactone lactonase YvrE